MKYVIGKFYERRDGLQALYLGINPFITGMGSHVFASKDGVLQVYSTGNRYIDVRTDSDIIGEWIEIPKVGSKWKYKKADLIMEIRLVENGTVVYMDKTRTYYTSTLSSFIELYKEV